jgi:hypothetical protein
MLAFLLLALAPLEFTGEKAQEIKVYARAATGMYHRNLVMRTAEELNKATPKN